MLAVGDQLVTKVRPYPARTTLDVYSSFSLARSSAAGATGRASVSVISKLLLWTIDQAFVTVVGCEASLGTTQITPERMR